MSTLIPWTEIKDFSSIRKYALAYPEIVSNKHVTYKCKVKLHGTNAAIQINKDEVVAQSRQSILKPGSDNAGFAAWVESTKSHWSKIAPGWVIFGEWCGPGIQKNVAISEIPNKSFAVFAARATDLEQDILLTDPSDLLTFVEGIPNAYVLPWYPLTITVDWLGDVEPLESATKQINEAVNKVELSDPWVKETFNVDGTGEGLVFYPESHPGLTNFNNLVFKAKGEKHKNISKAAPAQVNPEVAASVDEFVSLVLTEARLEQGATFVGGFEMKLIGKFVPWISTDVQKETKNELEASNLTWKQVEKVVLAKAKEWYINKAKAL